MADITGTSAGWDAELLVEPATGVTIPSNVDGSGYTFDSSSERYVFDSEDLRRTTEMIDATGIRGTRTKHYGRVVAGNYTVAGSITMRPGQTQIDTWLPRILYGTEETGHHFPVEALVMTLEIFGMSEAIGVSIPGSAPAAFTYNADSLPVLFSTGTLTLGSDTYLFEDFEVVIDNMVEVQFRNSATALAFVPLDRVVTMRVNMDYTATSTFYGAETAVAGTLNFVPTGGTSFGFVFPKLIAPKETPVVPGKVTIMNDITFTAYGDDYTDYTDSELYIINDETS
jgi:hypothetical protein